MDRDRWQAISALFEELVALPQPERGTRLAALDPDTRSELQSLLAAHEGAGEDFLQPSTPHEIGARIGAYRLVREIGAGGMGRVFVAERADDEFSKQVALKIVRLAAPSPLLLERFRTERQILARLEHPSIARLLDGGSTDGGLPYLVMEYVEGTPLDTHADGLALRERIALFGEVCRAVHYAHTNLVVHRDLKPSNILVTANGTPKLLDFGIAKLLGDDDPHLTRTLERPMTPQFASPEQVRNDAVTTASDVYALGVLLYRIVTGSLPYELAGLSASRVERVVCDEPPARPSSSSPRIARDLETIVLKALRKEPERRYASAEQFAEDLDRYLRGRPVLARPDTLGYRTSTFLRRNPWGVGAVLAILLAVTAGLLVAQRERARAERLFGHGRTFARSTLMELHERIRRLPGSTPARQHLVTSSLAYLEGVARERGRDPSLDLEVAFAYATVAGIQGNPTEPNLGDADGALASYREALEVARDLEGVEAARVRGWSHEGIGDILLDRGTVEEALAAQRAAIDELAAEPALRGRLAIAWLKLGDKLGSPNFRSAGRPEEAQQAYRNAEQVGAKDGRFAYLIHERLGDNAAVLGDPDAAIAAFRKSHAVAQARAAADEDDAQARRDLAVSIEKLGNHHRSTGDAAAALREYEAARVHFAAIQQADPRNANARRSLTIIVEKVADARELAGDPAGALALHLENLTDREALVELDPENLTWREDLARSRRRIDQLRGP